MAAERIACRTSSHPTSRARSARPRCASRLRNAVPGPSAPGNGSVTADTASKLLAPAVGFSLAGWGSRSRTSRISTQPAIRASRDRSTDSRAASRDATEVSSGKVCPNRIGSGVSPAASAAAHTASCAFTRSTVGVTFSATSLTQAMNPDAWMAWTTAPSTPVNPPGGSARSLRRQYRYVGIHMSLQLTPTAFGATYRLDRREHDGEIELDEIDIPNGDGHTPGNHGALVENTIDEIRQLERRGVDDVTGHPPSPA